ncbi:MAG: GntR family transcriptional regulator [Thermodesulfobacteriota bacterium]
MTKDAEFGSKEKPAEESPPVARDPVPLYYQLARRWGLLIMSEEWPPESRLPTEEKLAAQYGVSRLTVRKAKERLIQEGLVKSVQGSGSYVTLPDQWRTAPTAFLESVDDIIEIGQRMAFHLHDLRLTPNNKEIAEKLQRPDDQHVFQITGVRFFNGLPLSSVVYYLPFDLGSRIPFGSLDKNPYIPQFEKLLGIKINEGLHAFYPASAGRDVARLLALKPRSPVLVVESIYLDSEQRPVSFIVTRYRPDWRYKIRFRRVDPRAAARSQVSRELEINQKEGERK